MESTARPWVLPVVFALVVVSMPVQMVLADRRSEPYPGLFQPFFYGTSPGSEVTSVEMAVDGRRVEPFDLFPADGPSRDLVMSIFPPESGEMHVDDQTRRSIRAALARTLDKAPRELSVTWERRRFDRDTGRVTHRESLSRYRLDLTGRIP